MSIFRKQLLVVIGSLGILTLCAGTGPSTWPVLSLVEALRADAAPLEDPQAYQLGRPATEADIQAWNIDVSPNGEGLPPSHGTVADGARVYAAKCAMCHGPTGVEGPKDRLVGGQHTLKSAKPIKTIGSFWPYPTTLFDYIRRAMPFNAPQSLTPDEVYAVVAWLLFQNGIIREDAVLDRQSLLHVRMPNLDGFVPDPMPDAPK